MLAQAGKERSGRALNLFHDFSQCPLVKRHAISCQVVALLIPQQQSPLGRSSRDDARCGRAKDRVRCYRFPIESRCDECRVKFQTDAPADHPQDCSVLFNRSSKLRTITRSLLCSRSRNTASVAALQSAAISMPGCLLPLRAAKDGYQLGGKRIMEIDSIAIRVGAPKLGHIAFLGNHRRYKANDEFRLVDLVAHVEPGIEI